MSGSPSYSLEQLAEAVARSSSWRGVLRSLGLASTSSSAIRSVQRQSERAGLDHSHFARARRWTEAELRVSVEQSRDWHQVLARLGLGGSAERAVRAHSQRLGLDTSHLAPDSPRRLVEPGPAPRPSLEHLRHAAPLLAAASLRMRGHHVSWPLEPARYDLVVDLDGRLLRVQVKTTTHRQGARWTVWLSSTSPTRTIYATDEVDAFYVIDGDLTHYWIPLERVAGFQAIALSAYSDCVLATHPA